MAAPLAMRLWKRVEKESPEQCWLWTGAVTNSGYGEIRDSGRTLHTHRVAYELTNGSIPRGMCVCHSCDNKLCVNPDHLWLGTHQDNDKDRHQKGRTAKGFRLPQTRLSEEDVKRIQERVGSGEFQTVVARDFFVSHQHVNRIANKQRRII